MRNCESYVSSAIWHGEEKWAALEKEYENMGKTSSWTVCCFRAEKVDGGERERERWKLITT